MIGGKIGGERGSNACWQSIVSHGFFESCEYSYHQDQAGKIGLNLISNWPTVCNRCQYFH